MDNVVVSMEAGEGYSRASSWSVRLNLPLKRAIPRLYLCQVESVMDFK